MDDAKAKGRTRSGIVKLTPDQVLAIRKDTRVQRVIAEEYGIEQTNVSAIKLRKSWRHLEDSS